jgi:DNA-binding transcriptional ArsR family regulator
VTQCTEQLELTQGAVSKHIARLDAAGLLVRRREGRRTYQRVAAPERVIALLAHAEALAVLDDGARAAIEHETDPPRAARPGARATEHATLS